MSTPLLVAILVLVAGGIALALRIDTRLVLALAGAALFVAAGRIPDFAAQFALEMANPRTVVPICSAWGFARILKLTECDCHLVHLLLRPMRAARWLLVPGGVAACFIVNTAVVSQTGTASIVGPLLVPLLLAAGFGPVTAGAVLLLGSSMGGELFNPGAVELATLAPLVNLSPRQVVARVTPANLLACGVALLVFWIASVRWPPRALPDDATAAPCPPAPAPIRVNLIKALVPLLPLAILFLLPAARHHLPPLLRPPELPGHVEILAAMLIGSTAAALTAPSCANKLTAAFFEGAGYAYAHVVSFIVVATTFAAGIAATGLIERAAAPLVRAPAALTLASAILPGSLAVITGTGIGTGVPLIKILVPLATQSGAEPLRIGTLVAIFAQFGRTSSPVAPVVILCATFAGVKPTRLLWRVGPALLAGATVLVIGALFKWI
jgi:DcuC family C4-dicarboxylate transporter